jgi:undecaprenyl-diphosphatase
MHGRPPDARHHESPTTGDGLNLIQRWDTWLFYLINVRTANPVFDAVMPFITQKEPLIYVLAALWLVLFWRARRRGRIVALATLVVIAVSDQASANLFKSLFARARPPYALDNVRLLVDTTRSFSFPSAHAANAFALASFVSSFYRRTRVWLYAAAALVAYSRVYVGVHYPTDILAGAALGLAVGLGTAYVLRRFLGPYLSTGGGVCSG